MIPSLITSRLYGYLRRWKPMPGMEIGICRAFYDDGSLLGSSKNIECQIDSIAQSWAVLSGAADPVRARQAMESVNKLLIREADQLIMLLTPPFDKTPRDPGYIKGYLPGVRENGGQYTHAAIWSVWAYASLGQGDRAQALYRLLNPVYHSDTLEKAVRYKTEPYNIAADIYSVAPHTGTWRLDGVHGFRGLDVSSRHRSHPGRLTGGKYTKDRSLYSEGLAWLQTYLPIWYNPLPDQCRKSGWH